MATTDKPRRKRRTKASEPSTTAALVALTENGLSRTDAGRALGLRKEQVDAALDEAKLEMQARAADYARLHMVASEKAAEKGKAEPMQWALERLGVVQPAPVAQAGPQGGTTIKIGILLPGLSERAITATQVTDGDTEPA